MNELDQLQIFGEIITPHDSNIQKVYNRKAVPLVNGKEVSLTSAIKHIKKIIFDNNIHFSGLSCDLKTIDRVIQISEKNRFSLSHVNQQEISNFYSAFYKFGCSNISMNEMKNRADTIFILGEMSKPLQKNLVKYLNKMKKRLSRSVYFISSKKKSNFKNHIYKRDLYGFINSLSDTDLLKKDPILNKLLSSRYPVCLIANTEDFLLTQLIFQALMNINNKTGNCKTLKLNGINNSGGYVNSCIVKSGFPGPLNFSDWGISFNNNEIVASEIIKRKNIQFSVSNFSDKKSFLEFKYNILIGNPNSIKQKHYDVFIPTKTPGIDCDGLVLRSDGVKVIKLKGNLNSDYLHNSQILEKVFS